MSHWSHVLYSCLRTIKPTVATTQKQLQWAESEWAQGMSEGSYVSISQGPLETEAQRDLCMGSYVFVSQEDFLVDRTSGESLWTIQVGGASRKAKLCEGKWTDTSSQAREGLHPPQLNYHV